MTFFLRKELESALNELHEIKQNGPFNTAYGICNNIVVDYETCFDIVREYAVDWKEYSGDSSYPVPASNTDKSPLGMYYECQRSGDMWDKDTEYGRSRWRLVDYLIECITQDLQKMNGDTNA